MPLHLLEEPELFVKCFDVTWSGGRPEAVAQLEIEYKDEGAPLPFRIVPVVFITNEVMRRVSNDGSMELAQNILLLLDNLLGYQTCPACPQGGRGSSAGESPQSSSYRELQIDCDWTAGSRKSYFKFLSDLKSLLPEEVTLSVTVRLHQFRDRKAQGIPPADRGSLMVYNVGDLNRWETENSIIDSNITTNYLTNAGQGEYPLALDLALPLYQWGAVYRQGKLAYLIDELGVDDLSDSLRFESLNQHRYFVSQKTYLDGYLLYSGDNIRLESSPYGTLSAVAKQLSIVPSFEEQRLLFYRIGSELSETTSASKLRNLSHSIR
ncbi:hypothetical protein CEQ90_08385 [Lewinellaceae bacterium SD302]|nr:hypothetical protein CEQ90_08385 [Lewinellaceae bacterium SD302]